MKILLVLVAVIFAVQGNSDREQWLNFKTKYEKIYKNIQEETFRYNIFQENLKKIKDHNQDYNDGKSTFQMDINKFADLTNEEFRKTLKPPSQDFTLKNRKLHFPSKSFADIPDSIDWREKGAVTPVRNQGSSGTSCIFGIVGALEGQYFLKSGNLVPLSEQNLEDCADVSFLCDIEKIFDWIKDNGIMSEADYPPSDNGTCHFNKSDIVTKISSYEFITPNDEIALQYAVATIGPIAAVIEVSPLFQFYTSGILNDPNCNTGNLNHGVLIVGYGSQNGQDYWIVKNSWGLPWGEEGYILMSRNKNNQCEIASSTVYPII